MLKSRKGVDGMSKAEKKSDKIVLGDIKPEDRMKYEIATELGLLDKVMNDGWKALSAKETGRIGGIMTKRKKQIQMEAMKKP